jgi:hypothetical protein
MGPADHGSASPLMGPAAAGTVTPLMGPADPATVTPLMGPADRGTVVPLMGPADPGTATPLMLPGRQCAAQTAGRTSRLARQTGLAAAAGNRSRYRVTGADTGAAADRQLRG